MNAQQFRSVAVPPALASKKPMYSVGDQLIAVKGPGNAMQPEPRLIGKVCYVKGVHFFHGDTEHHYSVAFNDGTPDSIDQSCLRRF